MKSVEEFLETISVAANRNKLRETIQHLQATFPELDVQIKWNTPMFIHQGRFILGFGAAQRHFSVAPEVDILNAMRENIAEAGYQATKNQFKVPWDADVQVQLLEKIVAETLRRKGSTEENSAFWGLAH